MLYLYEVLSTRIWTWCMASQKARTLKTPRCQPLGTDGYHNIAPAKFGSTKGGDPGTTVAVRADPRWYVVPWQTANIRTARDLHLLGGLYEVRAWGKKYEKSKSLGATKSGQ